MACRSNGKYFGPLRRRNNEASELRHGTNDTLVETTITPSEWPGLRLERTSIGNREVMTTLWDRLGVDGDHSSD